MYRECALKLFHGGWQTVPATGKRVLIPNWPVAGTTVLKEVVVKKMAGNAYPDSNIGLPFGDACPAFAVDIDSVERADELTALAHKHLGETPFIRIGRAPRSALFYGKVPGDTYQTCRIPGLELFAAGGSQMIIYGVHPTTNEPYRWLDKEPLKNAASELPAAPWSAVARFLNEASQLLGIQQATNRPQGQLQTRSMTSKLETHGLRGWEFGEAVMSFLRGMEPGNRDERLTQAIAALVARGFSDEKIFAVLEEPYIKRWNGDGTDRRGKINKLVRRTRRRFGGENGTHACREFG
jgi:hypothetical protein